MLLLDVMYNGKIYTVDATATIKDPGRYINHASRNNNLFLMKLIIIGEGKCRCLRIGFTAKKAIQKGVELFFEYGIRNKTIYPGRLRILKKVNGSRTGVH